MYDEIPTLEKIKIMLEIKWPGTNKEEISEETMKEFEDIFNGNQAIKEVVDYLVNYTLISEAYRCGGFLLLKKIAHIYKADPAEMEHAMSCIIKVLEEVGELNMVS